jgi:hypothetical protein
VTNGGFGGLVSEEEFGEVFAAEGARPFAPEEMVACEACVRANPPTRLHCLYCGAALPVTERSARLRRPTLKKLEEWEAGFSVILHPPAQVFAAEESVRELASLLRAEPDVLRECLAERRPLPLARVGSREEAELIVGRFASAGLGAETLSDEDLLVHEPPRRVRALALTEDELVSTGQPGEEPWRMKWAEVGLLVTGRIVRKRVEVEERREKSRRDGEVVDSRELTTDEEVLDIYSVSDEHTAGWRVMADNFDYTCLGARKSLLARENFAALVRALGTRAGGAVLDEDYARLRRLLAAAWPPAARDDTLGFRRERFGRYNTGASTVVSNEAQFTRYSRLRRHGLRRKAEG